MRTAGGDGTVQELMTRSGNQALIVSGEIDIATADSIRAMLKPSIEAGGPVTLDLSNVTFMDSTGIYVIIDAAKALGDRGCVVIHGAHGEVANLLHLTQAHWASGNIHAEECTVLAASSNGHRSGTE